MRTRLEDWLYRNCTRLMGWGIVLVALAAVWTIWSVYKASK